MPFNTKAFQGMMLTLPMLISWHRRHAAAHKIDVVLIVPPIQTQPVLIVQHGVEAFVVWKRNLRKPELFGQRLIVNAYLLVI